MKGISMAGKQVEESSTVDHPERMLVNIYGLDGRHVAAGEYVPGEWDRDYVETLIRDRAARVMTDEEAAALQGRLDVDTTVNTSLGG